MKKFIQTALFCIMAFFAQSQGNVLDSLRRVLQIDHSDTGRILILCAMSSQYQNINPDSALFTAQEALILAQRIKYLKGQGRSLSELAAAYTSIGDFPKALDHYLQWMKIEEIRGFPDNIAYVDLNIALLYTNAKDYDNALLYARKSDSITRQYKIEELVPYVYLNIGDIFEKKNMLDSALAYSYKCLEKSKAIGNDLLIGTALNNLGNAYSKMGMLTPAHDNYLEGLSHLEKSNDFSINTESMLGLAKIYEQQGQMDSALYYGRQSYNIARHNSFMVNAFEASVLISRIFKKQSQIDSSFAYQESMIGLKDSIYSREKVKDVSYMTTAEQLRQKEIQQQKELEKQELRQKLQLLGVGILIPMFFLLSVVVSRRKVNKRLVEFLGIVSILMFFEYLTLLIHPFVAEMTHHNAFYEIVIFVAIAAVITPLHHRFQHWVINKLKDWNSLRNSPPREALRDPSGDESPSSIEESSINEKNPEADA